MTELIYGDLLTVPFKINGRDKKGMDCYGLVLECCRRTNQNLHDIVYDWQNHQSDKLNDFYPKTNTEEIEQPATNCIVQCNYNNELHVGFMLNPCTVIHMTYEGVRISPLFVLKDRKYYRVKK